MGVVLLWLWLGLTQASCPRWNCASLPSDTCVQWSQDRVLVNDAACSNSNYCSLAGIQASIRTANLTMDQGTVPCAHNFKFEPNPAYVIAGNLDCWLKDDKDRLREGTAPKQCSKTGWEDEACRLANGHMAECLCGLDGNFYCGLGEAEPVLASYWQLCSAPYISKARQAYWAALREYYILFSVSHT